LRIAGSPTTACTTPLLPNCCTRHTMAHLTISLLGPFRVTLDGESVTTFESDKVRALLAYLAVEAEQSHRRETLVGLLWPEWPERSARHSLSQALSNLRRAIDSIDATESFFLVTQRTIQFNADSDYTLDATMIATLLEVCEGHYHDEIETCNQCMERLQQAVVWYGGGFLEGFSLGDSSAFEEWVILQRERFHRLATEALQRLSGCYERRGELDRALQHARRWLELDPWQEEAHRQLMRLLALSGRRNAALKQYRTCRRVLMDELGVEPSERTTDLYEQIRDGKYERPELSRPKKSTRDGGGLKSRPVRLLTLIVISVLFLVLGLDLLPGFLEPSSNQIPTDFCADQTDIPETECQLLVTLYNATGGADWKDSSGWLSDSTPCDWFGVTCGGGAVVELSLLDNNLDGLIPSELGDLRRLAYLDLYGNQLSGSVPVELGNLADLTVLDLSYNQLSGSIPRELGSLNNLRHLTVCGNGQLDGSIPPELGNLARLESLCLSSYEGVTQLSGPIPSGLSNLRRLEYLELSSSLVDGPIPPELGDLVSLKVLDLSYNLLSGPIPPELGNLSNLRSINVCGNHQLSGPIPPELGNLALLESLTLSSHLNGGTQLSGPIPPDLGNLRRLTHLDITNSLVSGPIPPELGNLTNLVHFSLAQNPLSGSIPPELGNLVNLTTLSVGEGYSELEGPLPLSLMNLKKLEYFTYAENTELCAPPDAEFQEWLDGIPEFDGPRVVCQSEGQ
jgi:DNA-binding SARP family transcriptional activator/Leucine-rich repeat (LRR) protein